MGVITALTVQKRNSDRLNVYLDGKFAFGLATAVAATLKVGQTLTPEQTATLQQQDDVSKAKEKAVQLISRRPRSVAEIERHLRNKEFGDLVIEQAVIRLQEVGLLDDEAFARYWVDQRNTFKPRSHLALRQELQQKGVERHIIETAVNEVDQTAAARHAAQKQASRYTHLGEDEFRQKLGGFLQRRGFHYETIQQVTNELWATISNDNEHNTQNETEKDW
ncbi:MAG: RecX family transcriptional regulator [Ardenticatenaceae bacterium]|nr:RecX family transcriptional regulator [Ardenticatenaceae bacterium]